MMRNKKDNIVNLPTGITQRCCPDCGYLVSQLEIDLSIVNMKCPRGCEYDFSQFQPLKEDNLR